MAIIFKMAAENWYFDHKSVNIEIFYVPSFAIRLLSCNTNLIEEKFFARFKMASEIQNGRKMYIFGYTS
jgi:hypothetical protein